MTPSRTETRMDLSIRVVNPAREGSPQHSPHAVLIRDRAARRFMARRSSSDRPPQTP